jgi:hypothetical protein
MEGRERSRDWAERKLRGGKGSMVGPPFTNTRYATISIRTVQCSSDRGCGTADECRAMLQLPCPVNAQAINIGVRNGVCYTV